MSKKAWHPVYANNQSMTFKPSPPTSNSSAKPTMNAPVYPSIFISCPCSDNVGQKSTPRSRDDDIDTEEEAKAFDPRAPRSTFSLFPLENLLFCEDCNQVRCPRCVLEEIVCYFCPSCLFEVPSSTVKSEGNRFACALPAVCGGCCGSGCG
jgi:hypothetical protein